MDTVVAGTAVGLESRFATAVFAFVAALFFEAEAIAAFFRFAPRERVTPNETLHSNRSEMPRTRIR
jgi:hypothetical protein